MKVTTSASGVILQPHGALDEEGCAALRQVISTALSTGLRHIVLDLSEVTRVETESVQLLRGVEQYLRRHDGGLLLTRPSPQAERGLRANDLTDLLLLDDGPAAVAPPRSIRAG